jgi:hypothetical protein
LVVVKVALASRLKLSAAAPPSAFAVISMVPVPPSMSTSAPIVTEVSPSMSTPEPESMSPPIETEVPASRVTVPPALIVPVVAVVERDVATVTSTSVAARTAPPSVTLEGPLIVTEPTVALRVVEAIDAMVPVPVTSRVIAPAAIPRTVLAPLESITLMSTRVAIPVMDPLAPITNAPAAAAFGGVRPSASTLNSSSEAALVTLTSPLMLMLSFAVATSAPPSRSSTVPEASTPSKVMSSSAVMRRSPPLVMKSPRRTMSESDCVPSPEVRTMSPPAVVRIEPTEMVSWSLSAELFAFAEISMFPAPVTVISPPLTETLVSASIETRSFASMLPLMVVEVPEVMATVSKALMVDASAVVTVVEAERSIAPVVVCTP